MKLVLDKFLWIATILMGYGLYQSFAVGIGVGLTWIISGAIVLILFMVLIVREYEVLR